MNKIKNLTADDKSFIFNPLSVWSVRSTFPLIGGKAVNFLVIAATLAALAGCAHDGGQWRPGKPFPLEKIIIGVIHISDPVNETSGYAYEHERGIREMRDRLGLGPEQIIRKVNVAEADQDGIESATRDCIALGANIIIATSYGYMDTCEKLAGEFPQVVFAHATGHKNNDTNFTNYFGRIYQARFLSGIAAGLKTKTNRIGYVAAMGKEN
ncbi:MAG: BMP family ABC transporter substrate-binding protein, partial [Spirochaetales bacterium]|nr:BMP family ABC transporter substrate-binding protein [Spirochaetales bacterium]